MTKEEAVHAVSDTKKLERAHDGAKPILLMHDGGVPIVITSGDRVYDVEPRLAAALAATVFGSYSTKVDEAASRREGGE